QTVINSPVLSLILFIQANLSLLCRKIKLPQEMSIKAKAFLFDLNGTMIDDMDFHLRVWHHVLTKELGSSLTLEEVRGHMYGKNHELLVRVFGEDHFSPQEMDAISQRKEEQYQELFKPHLKLLPGLTEFLEKAKQKDIRMAIGSAAIPFNINF